MYKEFFLVMAFSIAGLASRALLKVLSKGKNSREDILRKTTGQFFSKSNDNSPFALLGSRLARASASGFPLIIPTFELILLIIATFELIWLIIPTFELISLIIPTFELISLIIPTFELSLLIIARFVLILLINARFEHILLIIARFERILLIIGRFQLILALSRDKTNGEAELR